jgi:hypothetical protein
MSERQVFGNLKTRLSNKEIVQIHLSDIHPLLVVEKILIFCCYATTYVGTYNVVT